MKKAFTMIELVFVIVVIGILAAVIIPNTRTNPVQEAAIDVLSKVRYTQHLAIVNDGYDATDNIWFKKRWQIKFDTNSNEYSIVSDTTFAKDPQNPNKNITADLSAKYGVTVSVTGAECGTATTAGVYSISFDNLGRPLAGNLATATGPYAGTGYSLVKSNDCHIVLTSGTESATIEIAPETGFAKIL